jgi:hypothetical protein
MEENMMKKVFIAFSVVAVLLVSAFCAGCANQEDSAARSSNADPQNQTLRQSPNVEKSNTDEESSVAEPCYDDPANPVANQPANVGEPTTVDAGGNVEQCYDDPANPVAGQNYNVGEPVWND